MYEPILSNLPELQRPKVEWKRIVREVWIGVYRRSSAANFSFTLAGANKKGIAADERR